MEETQFKAFKFRLQPTEEQKVLLSKHFGCTRFVYNHFLKEKQEHYLLNGTTMNFNNCCSSLVALKKQEDREWLKEVNSQSLIFAVKNLETAYNRFFRKTAAFPRFKSKHRSTDSFTSPQHTILQDKNHLQIPKFKEGLKFIRHRDIKGKIRSATISKNPSGKFYVSLLCEINKEEPLPKTGKSIGIDLGLKDFLITSEGRRYSNPKFLKQYEQQLRIKQKAQSRKQKGSKNREKARKATAAVYEKITNSRHDNQHKISASLIRNYDLIAIESLNVKGMVKNRCLSKAISDAAWSSFVSKLKYKAEWKGKEVRVIDRFYPSSKTCSCCLHIKESLNLSERSWTCAKCGTKHDRDINAAKNILQRALTIKSSGTDDYEHGAEIRPKGVQKASSGIGCEVLKKKSGRKYTLKPIGL